VTGTDTIDLAVAKPDAGEAMQRVPWARRRPPPGRGCTPRSITSRF